MGARRVKTKTSKERGEGKRVSRHRGMEAGVKEERSGEKARRMDTRGMQEGWIQEGCT
jgi:hypothetical protein